MVLSRVVRSVALSAGGAATVVAALVAFGTAAPPPPMPAVDGKAAADARREPLPPLQTFAARDGVALAYRSYLPARGGEAPVVAVLIHGSGGSSANMNILGRALMADGVPAFAPDVRGHGASGVRGDIDHVGQLEDDLADLVALVRRSYPHARLVLVGHSSGGGFALRAAGEPVGRSFGRFVLLAPYLGHAAPTTRPASGGWVSVYQGRIAGLVMLNMVGVHAFDGLPVLAFAGRPGRPVRTWSYRLTANFGPSGGMAVGDPQAYRADAARAPGPVTVVAGAKDESMVADRYAAAFAGVKPPVAVEVLPNVGHMDLLSDPAALARIRAAVEAR
jgi:alpha-beta hydrolase superfamily lysophospholipase